MKYKVLKNFVGVITGYKGKIISITDKKISDDLLVAKYIEPVKPTTTKKSSKVAELNED